MKKFLVLTLATLCSVVGAENIKSSIGACHMYFASDQEEQAIPYVTDGLYAMWDGEWNSGIGVHTDIPTIIVDLVGDSHMTVTGTRNNYGLDYFAPNSIYGGRIRNEDTTVVKDAIEANDCTIEFCMTIQNCSNGASIFDTTGNSSTRLYSLGNYILCWSQIRGSLTNLTGEDLFPSGTSHTVALRIGGEYSALFIDGICRVRPVNVGTKTIDPSLEFGYNSSGLYRYHSIRVSRALSDEEIMFNHLIDKARFGF